jgi:hypothetical protein
MLKNNEIERTLSAAARASSNASGNKPRLHRYRVTPPLGGLVFVSKIGLILESAPAHGGRTSMHWLVVRDSSFVAVALHPRVLVSALSEQAQRMTIARDLFSILTANEF